MANRGRIIWSEDSGFVKRVECDECDFSLEFIPPINVDDAVDKFFDNHKGPCGGST